MIENSKQVETEMEKIMQFNLDYCSTAVVEAGSQRKLAEKLNLHKNSIQKTLSEKSFASLNKLRKKIEENMKKNKGK